MTEDLESSIRDAAVIDVGPGPARPDATVAKSNLSAVTTYINQANDDKVSPFWNGEYLIRLKCNVTNDEWNEFAKACRATTVSVGQGAGVMVPAWRYKRITFQADPSGDCDFGEPKLERLSNITFRNMRFRSVSIDNCLQMTFDGCAFEGPNEIGARIAGLLRTANCCSGLQVQNCTFKSRLRAITMQPLINSTALIAFNRFECDGPPAPDAVRYHCYRAIDFDIQTDAADEKTVLGITNNVFIFNNERAQLLWLPEKVKFLSSIWLHTDHNIYHGPVNWLPTCEIYKGHETGCTYGLQPSSGMTPMLAKENDRNSIWLSSAQVPVTDIEKVAAGMGYAGVQGRLSAHSPVLWDSARRLRDRKNPSIGPVEYNLPGTGDRVVYHYVYDGETPVARDAFRNTTDAQAAGAIDYAGAKAETTRFAPPVPGESSLLFLDGDGTVDVAVADRNGRPWFAYRACEGNYTVPTYQRNPDQNPFGQFLYGAKQRQIGVEFRDTAMVEPPELPASSFIDYPSWYLRVLEGDTIMGRRGVAGWDGQPRDMGLWLPPLSPEPEGNWWGMIVGL